MLWRFTRKKMVSALESLTQPYDNSGGSSNIVEEIISVINEGDDENDNEVVTEE